MEQHTCSPCSKANLPGQPGCVKLMHWIYMCKANKRGCAGWMSARFEWMQRVLVRGCASSEAVQSEWRCRPIGTDKGSWDGCKGCNECRHMASGRDSRGRKK